MPLRPDLLTGRCSTIELPILPFLAPRVFTPWPSRGRRAHTGAEPAQKAAPNGYRHDNLPLRSGEDEQGLRNEEFSLRRLAMKEPNAPKQPPAKAADEGRKTSQNILGGFSSSHGGIVDSSIASTDGSSDSAIDDEFYKKYEEIWGIGQMQPSSGGHVQAQKRKSNERVSAGGKIRRLREVGRVAMYQKALPPRIWNSRLDHTRHDATRHRQGKEDIKQSSTHGTPRTITSYLPIPRKWRVSTTFARSPLPNPALMWQKRFALLHSRQNRVVVLQKLHDIAPSEEAAATQALWEHLINAGSSMSLRKVWEALPLKKRRDVWLELMLLTLDKHPSKALKFLAATYIDPYPPCYAVGDSLDFIISYYFQNRTARSRKNALEIFRVFEHMIRLGPPNHFQIRQTSVFLLLKNLENALVGRLFHVLTEYGHRLQKNTLMQFPRKLRLSGGKDERLEVLNRLRCEGSDFNSPEMMSVCTTLLQRKNRTSDATLSDSVIFEFMLDCGMIPNIVIYNVLLQNALEACDHDTGWQIHDMMIENGIRADAYTYSLLLSDAKFRKDRSSIERVINIISEKGIRNAHVATDLLHTIYLFRRPYDISLHEKQTDRPLNAFEGLLLVYRQYFHIEPLARLIPWFEDFSPPVANEELMDAPAPTLVIMLTALLRQLLEPRLVARLYQHFCDLLQDRDSIAVALSESTHICNLFLKALGRFPETLALCPRLIGHMLSQNIAATSDTNEALPHAGIYENESLTQVYKPIHDDLMGCDFPARGQALSDNPPGLTSSIKPLLETVQASPTSATSPSASQTKLFPKPDVYTWSVLLKAFMDHGQPRAAEKVLMMMKDRGVWPNQVTWNSMIIGYARMQDMSMTVDAVHRLQKGGFALDDITLRGLAYFENRRALIEAMKASETSDPGRSIQKRPAMIGKARTALVKTLRMAEGADLEAVAEITDDSEQTDNLDGGPVSSMNSPVMNGTGQDEELVVGDIRPEKDENDLGT